MTTSSTFSLTFHTTKATIAENLPIVSIQASTQSGAFGLLKQHQPLLASLSAGKVAYTDTEGTTHSHTIRGGILASDGTTATIMAN
jgi:F0F1-type ATP synthase epsilon subunit